MGYTKNAIAGFSWQTILKLATSAMTLVKISILARLLSPTDFGLFSLTAVALGVTESLTQTGINLTIIQAKESIRYFIDTAWVIAIIRGLIIGCVMLVLGWGISNWYQEPALLLLIGVAALVPVIKGFINPAIITLHKDMRFFHDSLYRFSLSFIEALVAVIAGFLLHSVWALVIALIGTAIFEVLISFIFFTDKPRFRYYASRAQVIIRNGKWLGLATILNYLNENADNVILGKIVGTHSLGLYQNSYALSHKVNYDVAKSIHHGVIPIYAKINTQAQRLNPAFYKALGTTAGTSTAGQFAVIIFP
jgi:O-antigen/teichoic acid export membrane protein